MGTASDGDLIQGRGIQKLRTQSCRRCLTSESPIDGPGAGLGGTGHARALPQAGDSSDGNGDGNLCHFIVDAVLIVLSFSLPRSATGSSGPRASLHCVIHALCQSASADDSPHRTKSRPL